jgi:hypothetical protein
MLRELASWGVRRMEGVARRRRLIGLTRAGRTLEVVREVRDAPLRDLRLRARLVKIAVTLASRPKASLPTAAGNKAKLKAMYRFFENDRVTPEEILTPHYRETVARAEVAGEVLVVHDTTAMQFEVDKKRKATGFLSAGNRGFFAHVSLAVGADGLREPFGVLNHKTWFREQRTRARSGGRKRSGRDYVKQPERESLRWDEGVEAAERRLDGQARAIHVMDREGDNYRLLAGMAQAGRRFVVRLTQRERSARGAGAQDWDKLATLAGNAEEQFEREVELSARRKKSAPNANRANPPRSRRVARLRYATTTLSLRRPVYLRAPLSETLSLNFIRVYEPEPPAGEPQVEWWLVTQEPTDTREQILRVVDWYRSRWLIEEYFKAIKSGCHYKYRELQSRTGLLNLLAVTLPIAYGILRLRYLARHQHDMPAASVLNPVQLALLRSSDRRMPENPTLSDALRALAIVGGHVQPKREPGWEILCRGWEQLILMEEGWRLAFDALTCGES